MPAKTQDGSEKKEAKMDATISTPKPTSKITLLDDAKEGDGSLKLDGHTVEVEGGADAKNVVLASVIEKPPLDTDGKDVLTNSHSLLVVGEERKDDPGVQVLLTTQQSTGPLTAIANNLVEEQTHGTEGIGKLEAEHLPTGAKSPTINQPLLMKKADLIATLMLMNEYVFSNWISSKPLVYTLEALLAVYASKIGHDLKIKDPYSPIIRAMVFMAKDHVWDNKENFASLTKSFIEEEYYTKYLGEIKLAVDMILSAGLSITSPNFIATMSVSSLNSILNYWDEDSSAAPFSFLSSPFTQMAAVGLSIGSSLGMSGYKPGILYNSASFGLAALYACQLASKAIHLIQTSSASEDSGFDRGDGELSNIKDTYLPLEPEDF
jgi:hypothetical protein